MINVIVMVVSALTMAFLLTGSIIFLIFGAVVFLGNTIYILAR
jgi:hypothetical protein